MTIKRAAPWVLFFAFVALAMVFHQGEPLFVSQGAYPLGKPLLWLILLGFVGYSYYCSTQENIFKTIKRIFPLHWARQIGLDLYLGLILMMFIIYLNEGSLLVLALWLVPIVLFANLATLLYVALNYDSLVARFIGV